MKKEATDLRLRASLLRPLERNLASLERRPTLLAAGTVPVTLRMPESESSTLQYPCRLQSVPRARTCAHARPEARREGIPPPSRSGYGWGLVAGGDLPASE